MDLKLRDTTKKYIYKKKKRTGTHNIMKLQTLFPLAPDISFLVAIHWLVKKQGKTRSFLANFVRDSQLK